LAAANARIGVATAELFPQVAVVASIGSQSQGWGTTPDISKHLWSFGPGATWPLLDFGALDAQVEIAKLRRRELLEEYRKTVLTAVREVDTYIDGLSAQQGRAEQLEQALEAGQRAADLANQRYNRGLTDFLNVVDAERQLYDLEEQYASAQVGEAEQYVYLYKALGGGWQSFQSVPAIHTPTPAVLAAFRRLFDRG
jgi:outer membrane protein TolC